MSDGDDHHDRVHQLRRVRAGVSEHRDLPGRRRVRLDGKKHAALSGGYLLHRPEKCTECVGFYDYEACAAVCPVDCCVTDPDRPEPEEVLLERARHLHPETEFGEEFPSRFHPGRGPGGARKPAAEGDTPAPTSARRRGEHRQPVPLPSMPATMDLETFEVPVTCRTCDGEFAVAFQFFPAWTRCCAAPTAASTSPPTSDCFSPYASGSTLCAATQYAGSTRATRSSRRRTRNSRTARESSPGRLGDGCSAPSFWSERNRERPACSAEFSA